jgi:monofunctional biosynthetic peptidoglycan transglycosylase
MFWKRLKKTVLWILLLHLVYILVCRFLNPPITLTQIGNLQHGLKRDMISLDEMGTNIKLAVIAGEDQLFPVHNGFDVKRIKMAMKHNEKNPGRRRGASTISQQTAKNVFLWQGGGFLRKGLEVYFTFMIETLWPKKRILQTYLNVAETGKGIFGVQAAAKTYFNKNANQLTRLEAAQIAACLPNPKKYTVKPLSAYVARRSQILLRQMNAIEGDPGVQEILKK